MDKRYNIEKILTDLFHLKALMYPGIFLSGTKNVAAGGGDYSSMADAPAVAEYTKGGTPLRKKDALGFFYFMPVTIGGIEIPFAVISATTKKNIVETPMVGRRGSVKELISADDYQFTLSAILMSDDYPEDLITQIRTLYDRNEAVELSCALSDLLLEQHDKVVITRIEWPSVGASENIQRVKMTMVSDAPFELIINQI